MSELKLYIEYFNSPLGELEITCSNTKLLSLVFVKLEKKSLEKQAVLQSELTKMISDQLKEYFAKKRTLFDVPLQPAGTDFQKKVWTELVKIPFGSSISYMALAKKLEEPDSLRAIANANSKNPISIIIPCHRVIGSDGKLVGYSGDLWRKKWLLEHESNQEKLF